jgi:hypothetical protein
LHTHSARRASRQDRIVYAGLIIISLFLIALLRLLLINW